MIFPDMILLHLKKKYASKMDKPKHWVKKVILKFNPMAGFVHV